MVEFFTKEEGNIIIEAIKNAERETSGEIRVHLEEKGRNDILKDARIIFRKLGMAKTKDRNGILILIAPDQRKLAIYGDQGINEKVSPTYWNGIVMEMQEKFGNNLRCEGVCEAVRKIGSKLKEHFPYKSDDVNELPDEISYG